MVATLREQRQQLDAERAILTRGALALERLQLAERLHEDLVAGMDSLIVDVDAAERARGDEQAAAVAAIETAARALLAKTRQVVVSLADANDGSDSDGPAYGGQRATEPRRPAGLPRETRGNAAVPWAALAAAVLCVGLLIEVRGLRGLSVPMPIAVLGCFTIAAPVALMWSRPLAMTVAVWAAAALFSVFVVPLAHLFTAIGLSFVPPFMVAYFCPRRRALVGLGLCCLGQLAAFGWGGILSFASNTLFLLCAWVVGRVLHSRARLVDELRVNNALLAQQHEAGLRQAVAGERARVARELHDSIGHSLTIIALQAGAARRMWTSDPRKAQAALATIRPVAAQGAAELRLGFSTDLGPPGPLPVNPVTDVDALLDNARAAGLTVSLRTDGEQPELSGGMQLAVFRVLQEALTNVLRHATGSVADVTVRNAGSHVELVVVNSASPEPPAWPQAGTHGQRGMRQRVEIYGGQLQCGPRADGGFEVRARFPVGCIPA